MLIILAIYVWPTRYKNYAAGQGPHVSQVQAETPYRVDRLSADIEVLETTGLWRKVGNARKALAFQGPNVNPNVIHNTRPRNDQNVANQQQSSIEKTQKEIEAATEKAAK